MCNEIDLMTKTHSKPKTHTKPKTIISEFRHNNPHELNSMSDKCKLLPHMFFFVRNEL